MKRPVEKREEVLLALLNGEVTKQKAADLLGCTTRTIEHYRRAYRRSVRDGLIDHRHSNYHKLTEKDKETIVLMKRRDAWRSGRNIRDALKLPVHAKQVRRVLAGAGLMRQNTERVNPSSALRQPIPMSSGSAISWGRLISQRSERCI